MTTLAALAVGLIPALTVCGLSQYATRRMTSDRAYSLTGAAVVIVLTVGLVFGLPAVTA